MTNPTLLATGRVRYLDCGDGALLADFDLEKNRTNTLFVLSVSASLDAQKISGLIESVAAFSTLTVHFDPLVLARSRLIEAIEKAFEQASPDNFPSRHWRIPVVYDAEHGPDLQYVADTANLNTRDIIELHTQTDYFVYTLGFLPGFAYLGDTPEPLHLPRKTTPRASIPAGSVAIAADTTAIYPVQSPGGWYILGATPVPLWNLKTMSEPLLRPGDYVSFNAIDRDTAETVRNRVKQGWIPTPEPSISR